MRWLDALAKKARPSDDTTVADRMAEAYEASSRGDYARALEIWGPLAHAGVARAQNNVGACFTEGLGVERDPKLALQWLALAAAAAVVPPAVLLGSTHSVAVLIKTHRLGASYWCALLMTVALAGCAFVLSFDALRDLAVSLGFHPDTAWLWPVAIDVSIAQSTLALLTLTPQRRTRGAQATAAGPPGPARRV